MEAVERGAFAAAFLQIRLRWRAFAGQPEDEARDSTFWVEASDAQVQELYAFRDLGNELLGRGTHWIESRPKPLEDEAPDSR